MKKLQTGLTHQWLSTSTPGCMDADGTLPGSVQGTWSWNAHVAHVPRAYFGSEIRMVHTYFGEITDSIRGPGWASLGPVAGI